MVKLARAVVLFTGLVGLSACGQLPTSSGFVQASRTQQCAKISWQDRGSARDINATIQQSDAGLTRLAYRPASRPNPGAQAPSPIDRAEIDLSLRSKQSIELSEEIRREHEKAYLQGIEHWLQAHLTVQVRSCPS